MAESRVSSLGILGFGAQGMLAKLLLSPDD